ncbi:Predicted dehydrogenase [Paramicrobacterium humi]|uniref:Predicted dehydrogenase n=1 Tax=Paramicrobacterium humi TaxID=640635 RepID=A0A1H4KCF6_9MICO|nr:aldo/keto reductase [Microbacterium humi]SEB56224.1 Predicted dehydrogenase [Microbacterium humi]
MDETGKLRWGIIGLGEIAGTFAEALKTSSKGALVAVASSDAGRARDFANNHLARAHISYEALLADPEIDAVYIATAHTDHAEWAIKALEAGKHVLCEKPLSPHPATTMAMIECARREGRVLVEGYMYRFHPQIQQMLEMIAKGAIGNVRHVKATYTFNADRSVARLYDSERAGGAILDVGGYPISLAMEVVAGANGRAGAFTEPREILATAELSDEGVDLVTTAHADFPDGITVHLRAGIAVQQEHHVRITGSTGFIELKQPWAPAPSEAAEILLSVAGEEPHSVEVRSANSYALEADAFADLVRSGKTNNDWAQNSIAIARTQFRWRTAAGVAYPFECRHADVRPTRGGRLKKRSSRMRYGTIPESDKRISRLVMGCDNQPDLIHGSVMWDDFFEHGGNAFDTAYEYNDRLQEKLLGQWMANRGVREDAFVIGKGAHTPYCTPEDLEAQLLETLEDLQTDYLDMYFMHRDNADIPVGEFVDVLDRYYQSGTIRAFGGSNWSRRRFEEANAYARAGGKQPMTALSNHFGLAEAIELPWAGCEHVTDDASKRWLSDEQIPVFAWASQARGFFARADRNNTSDPELVRCFYSEENFERLDRCRKLAVELGVMSTAVALAYVLHQQFPTFALFGPRTLSEATSSMDAVGIELSPEQVAWLDLRD